MLPQSRAIPSSCSSVLPGKKSKALRHCHPWVKPRHKLGFNCRLNTDPGNLLQGTALQMAEIICTSSSDAFPIMAQGLPGRIRPSSGWLGIQPAAADTEMQSSGGAATTLTATQLLAVQLRGGRGGTEPWAWPYRRGRGG